MFLVNDRVEERHQKIRDSLSSDRMISVVLAAADFEWTVRRAILSLGVSTTKDIRKKFKSGKRSGLKAYQNFWNEVKPHLGTDLAVIVPRWDAFSRAFELRHQLVHGISGTTGLDYASRAVDAILMASMALVRYAEEHHSPIYGRRILRIKPRRRRCG